MNSNKLESSCNRKKKLESSTTNLKYLQKSKISIYPKFIKSNLKNSQNLSVVVSESLLAYKNQHYQINKYNNIIYFNVFQFQHKFERVNNQFERD